MTNQFIPSVELTPEEMHDFFGVAGVHPNLSHDDLNSLHDDHTPASSSYHYPTAVSFHPSMLPQPPPSAPPTAQPTAHSHHHPHATNTGVNVLGASYSTGSCNHHNDDSFGCGDGGHGNDEGVLLRTERKRSREKQRRHDVNQQFTELNQTVRQIELETEEYRVPTYNSPNNRADMIARTVGLLKALHELHTKKQQEIQHLREELQRAQQAGEEAAAKLKEAMLQPQNLGNNKVLMMVPMMMSAAAGAAGNEAGSHGGTAGPTINAAPHSVPPFTPSTGVVVDPTTGLPNHNHMMMPWMQQMMAQQMMPMMMMPSVPPPAATTATLATETTTSTTNLNNSDTTTSSSSPPADRSPPPHHHQMVVIPTAPTLDQGEQKMSSNNSLNNNNESNDNGNFVVGPNLAHCA